MSIEKKTHPCPYHGITGMCLIVALWSICQNWNAARSTTSIPTRTTRTKSLASMVLSDYPHEVRYFVSDGRCKSTVPYAQRTTIWGAATGAEDCGSALTRASYEIVKILLDAGADINFQRKDFYNQTPLHYFALLGNKDIVELLLDAGANKQIKDDKGDTPYDLTWGKPEIARMLAPWYDSLTMKYFDESLKTFAAIHIVLQLFGVWIFAFFDFGRKHQEFIKKHQTDGYLSEYCLILCFRMLVNLNTSVATDVLLVHLSLISVFFFLWWITSPAESKLLEYLSKGYINELIEHKFLLVVIQILFFIWSCF
jgi:hypothetical protein